MSTLAIIQARLGSTRFPKKVLARFAGCSMLEHVWRRVHAVVFHTVVACPARDTALIRECQSIGASVFAWPGDENDVLGRFRACAATHPRADVIVRITADCPFVQPEHVLATSVLGRAHGFARLSLREGWPDGVDVEAFTPKVLSTFASHEHVTAGAQPAAVIASTRDLSKHRWTLDTRHDLAWFRQISEIVDCKPPFHPSIDELLKIIDHDPEYGHFV